MILPKREESWKEDTLEGLGEYSRVWVRVDAKNETWQCATLRSLGEKESSVALDTPLGEGTGEVKSVLTRNLVPANPSLLSGAADLTRLSFLNEPSLLHNLLERHSQDSIYTHAGPVLIAVNPFKSVNLYSKEHVRHYVERPASGTASQGYEPHIFLTADVAFKQMIEKEKSQSILITGESGAGKTETTKFVMKYLAGLAGGTGMEDRILETNPILEAFGNAKTLHNNNSSRFGKLIEIYFNRFHSIIGALIKTYLLEKSRVVHQLPGERSYHIFYQLCRGATEEEREAISLPDEPEFFNYLSGSGCSKINGVDDGEAFEELKIALADVGISADRQRAIWRILSAILWLGNIRFRPSGNSDACEIEGEDSVQALNTAACLIGCTPGSLESALLRRRMFAGGEVIDRELSKEAAIENRDAFAKAIYEALFRWLVNQINAALRTDTETSYASLSILDIYGFECFQENSFEQLCINYANERLQAQFASHLFELEQSTYEKEGVDWARVRFEDNRECVDLIEARPPAAPGVLSLLDEECMFPKGTDISFLDKLRRTHSSHSRFIHDDRVISNTFTLRHFAGNVSYSVARFLDKNKDALSADIINLLSSSEDTLVSELLIEINKTRGGDRARGQSSVAARFREQLRDLIARLDETQLHFVRCIKPNECQAPCNFDNKLVLHQLKCCGILEVTRIARAGYPTRYLHAEFADRYRILLPGTGPGPLPEGVTPLNICLDLLEHFNIPEDMYQVGHTRIFFRAGVLGQLEDHAVRATKAALTLQSIWRMIVQRRKILILRNSCITIQSAWRARMARLEYMNLVQCNKAKAVIQAAILTYLCRGSYQKQRDAAVIIQSCWRGILLDRKLKYLDNLRASEEEKHVLDMAQKEKDIGRHVEYEAILNEFGVGASKLYDILTIWRDHGEDIEYLLQKGYLENLDKDETSSDQIYKLQQQCMELESRLQGYDELQAFTKRLETEIEELRDENSVLMESQAATLKSLDSEKEKGRPIVSVTASAGKAGESWTGVPPLQKRLSLDTISVMSYGVDENSEGTASLSQFSHKMQDDLSSALNDASHGESVEQFGRAGPVGAVAGLSAEFEKKSALFDDDASFIYEVNEGISGAYGMDPHAEFHNLMNKYKRWQKDFKNRLKKTNESLKRCPASPANSEKSRRNSITSRQSEGSLTSRLVRFATGTRS